MPAAINFPELHRRVEAFRQLVGNWALADMEQRQRPAFPVLYLDDGTTSFPEGPSPNGLIDPETWFATVRAGAAVREVIPLADLAKSFPHAEALYAAVSPAFGTPPAVILANLAEPAFWLHQYHPLCDTPAPAARGPLAADSDLPKLTKTQEKLLHALQSLTHEFPDRSDGFTSGEIIAQTDVSKDRTPFRRLKERGYVTADIGCNGGYQITPSGTAMIENTLQENRR